jgi:hypothetical protein
MTTALDVDCEKLEIKLTIKLWVGNLANQHIQAIRQAVRQRLNPNPPLRYFRCRVVVDVEISRAAARPKNHHHFELTPPSPQGGGATMQPGGGVFSPASSKYVGISPLPNGALKPETISHELGHTLGINDPAPTAKWDENGFTDAHITELFDNGSIRLPDGRLVGWHASAHCCRATHGAVTDRETGD